MAARRLVIAMIVLLVLSTLAAILVPPPQPAEEGEDRATTTTTTAREPRITQGRLVRATLDADSPRRRSIELRAGDELQLKVRSRRFRQIEVRGFGLIESAELFAPATFDLLADRPGRFEVRILDTGRSIGRIDVQKRRNQAG